MQSTKAVRNDLSPIRVFLKSFSYKWCISIASIFVQTVHQTHEHELNSMEAF